jgi:predicted nuclease of predicted toxin-antitoxin system
MKRLLLDQGLGRDTAVLLRNLGWDVIHVGEVGLASADDDELLERCRLESRVCVTLDADLHARLAVSGADRPSVVRIRMEGVPATRMAVLLQAVWARHEVQLDLGAVVTVTEDKTRLRPLPIRGLPV